jgi:hypothetical protein
MIAPTACDYGGAAQIDLPSHPGHTDGMNMDPQEHDVRPVAQTATSAPADDDAAETTTTAAAAGSATAARSASDRRRGEYDRRRRGDRSRTGSTIPAPAGGVASTTAPTESAAATDSASATATASAGAGATTTAAPTGSGPNGLDVLGQSCADSNLPPHTGFQSPDAQCVNTSMGEIAPETQLPSLLITNSPTQVGVGQPFKLVVSTRNLVRDRFLGAAAGGYYLESSFLNDKKLQRGHFHTACRMLASTNEAPDSSPAPAFFLATQDNGGGSAPDNVTIDVPATATADAGTMQCTSWAGDGSHRTPMMSRANQTPAIDSVRITISGSGQARQENVSDADAQADAAKQAQAEQAAAADNQAPDQDGAVQPLPEGVGTAAPADSADPAATESAAADPAAEAPADN